MTAALWPTPENSVPAMCWVSRAPTENASPLAMKKTLRPISTSSGLVGEATRSGRVPAPRSHVLAVAAVNANYPGAEFLRVGSDYRGRREITATFPGDAYYLGSAGSVRT